jgi:hypothetical protein
MHRLSLQASTPLPKFHVVEELPSTDPLSEVAPLRVWDSFERRVLELLSPPGASDR